MAEITGSLNGTDVKLAVESAPASATFNDIGGLLSNSINLNNAPIDVTNKSSASFRCIMDQEGLQSLDGSAEVIYSTDANFQIMKASWFAKSILNYQVARGAEILSFAAYLTSWAEAAPDNDKLTASISLQSSGPITEA